MISFKIIFDKKIRIETIDDSETTPGKSAQLTRFNSTVKPKLEIWLNSVKDMSTLSENTFEKFFKGFDFKYVGLTNNPDKLTAIMHIESLT